MPRRTYTIPVVAVASLVVLAITIVTIAALAARPEMEPVATATTRAPDPPAPAPTQSRVPRPAPVPTRRIGAGTITIAFAGDVHGEKHIGEALEGGEPLLRAVRRHLEDADLAVVNLETAIGDGGEPAAKEYNFRAPVALLPALRRAGVDVVSVANNHSLDFGWATLADGMRLARRAGLVPVGAGRNAAEAYAPAVFEIHRRRVAVLGLTRVIPYRDWAAAADRPGLASGYDVPAAVEAVRAARKQADFVAVIVHWGIEGSDCPDEHAVELGAALRDAGADVVVGAHPHVLQGVDRDPSGLTAYSLGNFLWYSSGPTSGLTGVLTVTLDDGGVADWRFDPAVIETTGHLRSATDTERDRIRRRLADRRRADPSCLPPTPTPSSGPSPAPTRTSAPDPAPKPAPSSS